MVIQGLFIFLIACCNVNLLFILHSSIYFNTAFVLHLLYSYIFGIIIPLRSLTSSYLLSSVIILLGIFKLYDILSSVIYKSFNISFKSLVISILKYFTNSVADV